jgi:broad specificity polyphosphatase/5'/3'-nucleotidase SurE
LDVARFEYIQLEVIRDTGGDLSVIITNKDGIDRFATSFANLLPLLNELGQDGWEVVSVVPTSNRARAFISKEPSGSKLEAETTTEERIYFLKRLTP